MGLGCASLDRRRQRRLSIIAPRRPNRPHIAFHICRRTAPLGRPAMWSPFRTASELKRDHLKRITSQLPVGDLEVVQKARFETTSKGIETFQGKNRVSIRRSGAVERGATLTDHQRSLVHEKAGEGDLPVFANISKL